MDPSCRLLAEREARRNRELPRVTIALRGLAVRDVRSAGQIAKRMANRLIWQEAAVLLQKLWAWTTMLN